MLQSGKEYLEVVHVVLDLVELLPVIVLLNMGKEYLEAIHVVLVLGELKPVIEML